MARVINSTVRYFKLMYIVAGILMSNEDICETVDKIQIAPCVEVKEVLQPRKVYRGVEKVSKSCLKRIDFCQLIGYNHFKARLRPFFARIKAFNFWTIPSWVSNYMLEHSTKYLSRKFIISSDCDMIYNR